MTEPMVHHMGETIALSKLIRHYRLMARNARFPRDRAFWRTLTRMVIAEYREQQAAPVEQRQAA